MTRDSGHGDIGSSLWWFPGTLGRPHLSQLLRRSLPWIKDPPGWRSAEDMPWLWRRAWGRGVREAGSPLPLRVHLDPACWTLPSAPGGHFLTCADLVPLRSPARGQSVFTWATAPPALPLRRWGPKDPTGWGRNSGMGVRGELPAGRRETQLRGLRRLRVCLASSALD